VSADCSGGVTYQYNITSNVIYLNSTDYEEFLVCSVTEGDPCELAIGSNFFGAWKDSCLLAYVILSPPYSVDPPTTHINVETLKRYLYSHKKKGKTRLCPHKLNCNRFLIVRIICTIFLHCIGDKINIVFLF